jgi:hypothetical protein
MDEICSTLYTGKGSVMTIIEELGCSKVCAHWLQQILIVAHKETKKAIATDLLHQYCTGGEGFQSQIVMGYRETWVQPFERKSRGQSMEWHHTIPTNMPIS